MSIAPFPSLQECDFDEAVDPGKVTLSGRTFIAAVIVGKRSVETQSGGYVTKRSASIQVRKSILRDAPSIGDVAVHEGVNYEINEVDGHPSTHLAWVLSCIESDRLGK